MSFREARHPGKLRVLTYHRIAKAHSTPHLDPRLISATPAVFELQMRYLARRFRVVDLRRVLEALDGGPPLPRRAVLITFDDAYRDFATEAWPILERLGLPATLFVPTLFPDNPETAFWWDRLYRAVHRGGLDRLETSFSRPLSLATMRDRNESLRRLQRLVKAAPHEEAMRWVDEVCEAVGRDACRDNGVLGWQRLKQLADRGVTLAAHTRTHAILSQLSPAQILEECSGSRQDLCDQIGSDLPVVSYPDGGYDEWVIHLVREAGFRLGLTTADGINNLASDDGLLLRRTNITPRTNPLIFRIRMHPQFARIDELRHAEPAR
jgi:peptidoglycan/xylan/chitin deacetylase (PgdA/CDA1 family)